MDYTRYEGSESVTDDKYSETIKKQTPHTISQDQAELSAKLKALGFSSMSQARQYLKDQSGMVDLRKGASPTTSTIAVGTVDNGFKFIGGDPNVQKNWKKIK